jgi:putative modified peptide
MYATPVTETFQRKTTQKQRSASLDPQVADRLLDLLSTDDAFRQLFQTSPQAALRSIGYVPDEADATVIADLNVAQYPEPFSLCEVGQLASKQAIRDARAVLKEVLMKGLAYNTPTLDAVNLPSIES